MPRVIRQLLFLLILLPTLVRAQGSAGQAGEFLRWGVGSKAIGLGRAFTSVADDASALYWNPAGLSALSRVGGTFMFTHVPLSEGASFNYLASAVPLRLFFVNSNARNGFVDFLQNLKLGVGVLWHSLGEFDFYNEDGSQAGSGSQNSISQSAIYVSASYPITGIFARLPGRSAFAFVQGDLHLGVTTKLVKQDLFGFGGNATNFDLGLKYAHHSGLFDLGFAWRDFNQPAISYSEGVLSDQIPATGILGVSLKPAVGALSGLLLSFDYGLIKPQARKRDFMFGAEYDLARIRARLPIRLRLGANSNHETITFGISFSPEILLGQDWVPSGDYTFASSRGSFDPAGSRFAISIDRNPFTAKYWYEKALLELSDLDSGDIADLSASSKYLKNAQEASNPGNRAYRFEATLREGDIEFLEGVLRFQTAKLDDMVVAKHTVRKLEDAQTIYTRKSAKYLNADYGKHEVDGKAYFKSFLYHVQGLILTDQEALAAVLCAERGKGWGKSIDVLSGSNGSYDRWVRMLNYMQAFALARGDLAIEAKELLREQLSENFLAQYVYAHIAFQEGDYGAVLETLDGVDLNNTGIPANVFLPLAQDRTVGDEILFLRAAAMYKVSGLQAPNEFISEFAKIPRFFPGSDLAGFLTNGAAPLFELIALHEREDAQSLVKLVDRLIHSYVETFSFGTLKEDQYAINFRQ